MRNKAIIQKADKRNTAVINDKDKYIKGVKTCHLRFELICPIKYYT